MRKLVAPRSPAVLVAALLACSDDQPLPLVASSVAAGGSHTCAVATAFALFCWGGNAAGQLGLGQGDAATHPRPERVAGNLAFSQVTTGLSHTCALASGGVAYCWGSNFSGQLGDGTIIYRAEPTPVVGNLSFASLSAGALVTCGITGAGSAYCWGDNSAGSLGIGDTTGPDVCLGGACSRTPIAVSGNHAFAMLSTGGLFVCGVTTVGAAYCWGANAWGQLGIGSHTIQTTPAPVDTTLEFSSISVGSAHTCGVLTDSLAYCWGFNQYGQLGNGTEADAARPVRVSGTERFRAVHAGGFHTCGLISNATAFCWGLNLSGELGNGSFTTALNPVAITGGLRFVALTASASGHHSCGRLASGAVYCWGNNAFGQLATGTAGGSFNRPLRVVGPSPD